MDLYARIARLTAGFARLLEIDDGDLTTALSYNARHDANYTWRVKVSNVREEWTTHGTTPPVALAAMEQKLSELITKRLEKTEATTKELAALRTALVLY